MSASYLLMLTIPTSYSVIPAEAGIVLYFPQNYGRHMIFYLSVE